MDFLTWKLIPTDSFPVSRIRKIKKIVNCCKNEFLLSADITGLPKLICNTLRLDRSAVAEDVSNFFTNFNTAKIIVEDASYIDLYGVVQAIVRYGEQFGILQEIDVTFNGKCHVRQRFKYANVLVRYLVLLSIHAGLTFYRN